MCRSAVSAAAVLSVLLAAAPAAAAPVPQATGIVITPAVRQTLQQLQEQWLQWMGAYNPQRSEAAVSDLLVTARQLGMSRLPDFAFGALARAVAAARQRDFARAHWALDAAERLDPGRPETAFAEATVAQLEGRYALAAGALAQGFWRVFSLPMERSLWLQSLLLWALTLVLVTGGLFVCALMATRGGALFFDLVALCRRRLGRPAGVAAAAALLLWPLALPGNLLWLALFWSLLLWGYASASERTVLVVLWLVLGAAPGLVAEQRRHVALLLSPPMQAMQSLEQHRLYGDLFTDLGVLRTMLPESPAVKQLLADVHRSLNQWEIARALYRQVLDAEPRNAAALLDLGAYSYLKGEWSSAIDCFQQASLAEPRNAAAVFNLSQVYSQSYRFEEHARALAQAKEIDSERVDKWLREAAPVVAPAGGLARIPEIRRALLASWHGQDASPLRADFGRYGLPLLLALAMVVLACTLHLARRPFGYTDAQPHWRLVRGRWSRLPRVLLPGLSSAEAGEGTRAFCALLLPTALAALPFFDRIGYRIPWGYDLGNAVAWAVSVLGLALYLGARLRWELRNTV